MKAAEFKKLGDYVKIKTGKLDANASSDDGEYPFFTCSIEPLKISSFSYDCECCLVAGNGDLNVKYYNGKFDAYQRTYIIESLDKEKLDVMYLYFFLCSYIEVLRKQSIGGVIKYIKLGNLTDVLIPIPSLEKQKKICRNLIKAQKVLNENQALFSKYDILSKSRFIEMFGTENDFSKWNCCFVEDVADVTVGVVIKPTQYYCEKGIPAFRSLNIGEMKVNDSDWVYFTEEGNEKNRKSILKENDVLVVRSGAPGKSCVITKKYEGYNVVDAIIAHPNLEKVNPVFLCMFTNMPHGMNQIKAKTGGAAQQHFNVGGYNSLKIILPPLSLQNDFAAFVQQIDKSKFEIWLTLQNYGIIEKRVF
mgnify:CR=1 FL=1